MNSHSGIKDVFLLGHRRDGAFGNTLDHVWYASTPTTGTALLADIQALFAVGDDLLSPQQDYTSVVTVGAYVRIQRLDIATLVVIAQPPHTCTTCQDVISSCAHVLTQRKSSNPLRFIQFSYTCSAFPHTDRPSRRFENPPVFVLLSDLEGSRDIPH